MDEIKQCIEELLHHATCNPELVDIKKSELISRIEVYKSKAETKIILDMTEHLRKVNGIMEKQSLT